MYNMEQEESAIVKTRRIGGSIVVTIPSEIVKLEQLDENQLVEIKVKRTRTIYFGALKVIGSFTREDRAKGQLD